MRDGEIARLAQLKGLSEPEFIARFARVTYCQDGLALREKPNGECILLEGRDCTVEAAKPQQCRNFPNVSRFPGFELACAAAPREVSRPEWEALVERTTGQKCPAAEPHTVKILPVSG